MNDTATLVRSCASIALAGLLLAACGGGHRSPAVGQSPGAAAGAGNAATRAVSEAAGRTLSLRANVIFRLDGARVFGPARAPVFGDGSFDFRAAEGMEVIDLPEAAHQELGNERAILLPARVYLQPKGTSSAVLPPGKSWMSASIAGSESVSTNFPGFVADVEGVNPLLALSELAWGTSTAEPLGEQLIDRAPAERYRVFVDLTRALAALRGPAAPALGQAIQQQLTGVTPAGSGGGSRAMFYVWVDRAGRLVEYQAAFPGIGVGTALVEMRSFGARVVVSTPAQSRVVDITSLTPSGERENNGGGDSDGG